MNAFGWLGWAAFVAMWLVFWYFQGVWRKHIEHLEKELDRLGTVRLPWEG